METRFLKKYSKIILKNNHNIKKDTIVIIDFYNVYCHLINFKKYRKFSIETWILTMKFILNTLGNRTIFLISKPIFEISDTNILEFTKDNLNINYIIVEDLHEIKSINKERDDYICILLQFIFNTNKMNKLSNTNKVSKLNTIIITNDHYNNYADIIKEIKEYNLRTYKGNTIFNTEMSNKNVIEYINKKLINYKDKLNKTGFYVSPKNYYNKKRKLN